MNDRNNSLAAPTSPAACGGKTKPDAEFFGARIAGWWRPGDKLIVFGDLSMNMSNRTRTGTIVATLLAIVGTSAMLGFKAMSPDEPPAASSSSSRNVTKTIVENDGKRTVKLTINNDVVSAEIDGTPVPADRIIREGDSYRIKDASGEVIYSYEAHSGAPHAIELRHRNDAIHGSGGSTPRAWAFSTSPGNARAFSGSGFASQPDAVAQIELPKVMIGVQLADPDGALRGHFGLKRGEATLISGVYEGLPAASAGLEPYDIVVSVDGKSPAGPDELRQALRAVDAGKSIQLTVLKKGERKTLSVTPEKYDAERMKKSKMTSISAGDDPFGVTTAVAGLAPLASGNFFPGGMSRAGTLVIPNGQGGVSEPWIDVREENEELQRRMEEMLDEWKERLDSRMERLKAAEEARRGAIDANRATTDQIRQLEEMLKSLRERQQNTPGAVPTAPPTPPTPSDFRNQS